MAGGGNTILNQPMVFVDIETNGLNHIRGRVIEVAAIRVEEDRITRVFNQLIDPGTELPYYITNLTGITTNDLKGAQTFRSVARELHDILSGAVFVAHNVRFDYSFLKQEFKRAGLTFLPRQLCTVKLSRTLYPDQKSHKLQSLIDRHGFAYQKRHRAYDDAHVLWQFVRHVQANFPTEAVTAAIARQIRQPAIPKDIAPELIRELPESPGVYIFEDEFGQPLYIGKSINIRKRVLQHFGRDHEESKEFKIAQTIKHVSFRTTGGELEALLLESQMVKELQPLHNRKLRRTRKLLLARQAPNPDGYLEVGLEDAHQVQPDDLGNILSVYTHRGRAKNSLDELQKTYDLCPKLLGLEKSKTACFLYQLGKCRGACVGREPAETYNRRLLQAFDRQRIRSWPYPSPVLLRETYPDAETTNSGVIIDQWCVIADVHQDEYCEPVVKTHHKTFDLDTYKILQSFMATKARRLQIQPLNRAQLQQFGI